MHDRTCQLSMFGRNLSRLNRIHQLNSFLQAHFRRWHEHRQSWEATGRVDTSRVPLLAQKPTVGCWIPWMTMPLTRGSNSTPLSWKPCFGRSSIILGCPWRFPSGDEPFPIVSKEHSRPFLTSPLAGLLIQSAGLRTIKQEWMSLN